ncbi:hypothetical protein E1B28_009284 [Marasmius oreades]|uniref:Uncharacterized protein n=1 Tax=Marasmius oreades TaxID=181124 RepID=A0A9P7S0D0_9AGAR|nr:uncharacterized protein E1B28_009284 [Marasmius oreades]KAG7092985.1 hypothetical protein E1B28_009284 [Marasmius oreades]
MCQAKFGFVLLPCSSICDLRGNDHPADLCLAYSSTQRTYYDYVVLSLTGIRTVTLLGIRFFLLVARCLRRGWKVFSLWPPGDHFIKNIRILFGRVNASESAGAQQGDSMPNDKRSTCQTECASGPGKSLKFA